MGKKTSVYLTDDLIPRVEAAAADGASLGDLVRRGLDSEGPTSVEASLRTVLAELLEPLADRLDALEKAVASSGVPSGGSDAGKPATARTEPRAKPGRAAPKSAARARQINAVTKKIGDNPRAALRALQSVTLPPVTPGTQVFREPGASPAVGHPVPGRSRKAGSR